MTINTNTSGAGQVAPGDPVQGPETVGAPVIDTGSLQELQVDTQQQSEAEATLTTPNAMEPKLLQPEVQAMVAAIVAGNIAAFLALVAGLNNASGTKKNASANESANAALSAAAGGQSAAAGVLASYIMAHEEGLKSVASDMVKKMMQSMPQEQVKTTLLAMMDKTKHDIIMHMWEVFQQEVDKKNELDKQAYKEWTIKDTDIKADQQHQDNLKYDRKHPKTE